MNLKVIPFFLFLFILFLTFGCVEEYQNFSDFDKNNLIKYSNKDSGFSIFVPDNWDSVELGSSSVYNITYSSRTYFSRPDKKYGDLLITIQKVTDYPFEKSADKLTSEDYKAIEDLSMSLDEKLESYDIISIEEYSIEELNYREVIIETINKNGKKEKTISTYVIKEEDSSYFVAHIQIRLDFDLYLENEEKIKYLVSSFKFEQI